MGHTKTILILVGGWVFFYDRASLQQISGICLAVLGMVSYGYLSM